MSNEKVIKAFLNRETAHTPYRDIVFGVYVMRGCTLNSYGYKLINYETEIAYWKNDILYLNTHKYSSTTSKIQSLIKRLAQEKGVEIVEYDLTKNEI